MYIYDVLLNYNMVSLIYDSCVLILGGTEDLSTTRSTTGAIRAAQTASGARRSGAGMSLSMYPVHSTG